MVNQIPRTSHRGSVIRLILKWLRAGISEDNDWSETKMGTPQGAGISPLLSNIYLYYVFDLWIEYWREKRCKGEVIVVRYADDFVIGFEHQDGKRGPKRLAWGFATSD